jgi:hypothetical protein
MLVTRVRDVSESFLTDRTAELLQDLPLAPSLARLQSLLAHAFPLPSL